MKRLVLLLLLLSAPAFGQGVPIKGGSSSDLVTVDANKNARVAAGVSTRASYALASTFICTAAANIATIEAPASTGFKVTKLCINPGQVTTSFPRIFTITRRTAASTAGTLATAEGTAVPAISKRDSADGNYGGVARAASAVAITGGTLGAVVDVFTLHAPTVGSATVSNSLVPFCREYGENGYTKPIAVLAGVANGINVADGAGGGAACTNATISIDIIVE